MGKILSQHKVDLVIMAVMVLYLCILVFPGYFKNTKPKENVTPTTPEAQINPSAKPSSFQYLEVIEGCSPYYEGSCVNVRSGPGKEYPVVLRLRTGVVLKVAETLKQEDGEWYKISFDEHLLYPERVNGNWFVAAGDYVQTFTDIGDQQLDSHKQASTTTTKRIVVSLSKEMLYAYDQNNLFMQSPISAGLEFTPTPNGIFRVYKKTPSRYMQGPTPHVSKQYYDLPGVPWDLYFTSGGDVIHGTYWHDHFGEPWSHGCVNLPSEAAKKLYLWTDVGTPVIVLN